MFNLVFDFICVGLISGALLFAFGLYLRLRTFSNRIMAVASKDFHDGAESMMETPEDLPESIINALSQMSRLAQAKGVGHQLTREMLRKSPERTTDAGIEFQREFDKMRPELQDLFHKVVISWVNFVGHQNVVTHLRVIFAVMRLKSQGLNTSKAEETVGFNLLSNPEIGLC